MHLVRKDLGRPVSGKVYSLTGLGPSIAAGNTWAESEVPPEELAAEVERARCAPPPPPHPTYPHFERDEAIAKIKVALRLRSGKAWSVTGGRGTAWGWITIDAPPARRTWRTRPRSGPDGLPVPDSNGRTREELWEEYDSGEPGHWTGPADRAELAALLALPVSQLVQGASVPAGLDYRAEFVDRAEGRTPRTRGKPYWD